MVKLRVFLLFLTFAVVGIFGTIAFLYAKGYRFDTQKGKITPQGLLVAKSLPDGAQLLINGDLKSATNVTLSLAPGVYDVKVKKAGYGQWEKRLTIEKEIVTEFTANLFKTTLSLKSETESGVTKAIISPDLSKIAYVVSNSENSRENDGLWLLENTNLPIGFLREPKRLIDGNLEDSDFFWSPKSAEIMMIGKNGIYLIDPEKYTPQQELVNVSSSKENILNEWSKANFSILESGLRGLPSELTDVLDENAEAIVMSPDSDMILYKAKEDAFIKDNLITPFPGASTQKQERNIKKGKTYIYDIKEDRNFLIDEDPDVQIVGAWSGKPVNPKRSLTWYPTSRHLILSEDGKVIIMDHDGTNRQAVYSGSYIAPYAFPTQDPSRILIITNLGATDKAPNFYSVSIK